MTVILSYFQFNITAVKVEKVKDESIKKSQTQIDEWVSLKKYIGTFPTENDFFKNPIIVNELKRILGNDYKSYCDHVSLSGCGSMVNENNLIYGNISQDHVGGYDSQIYIDIQNKKIYLFWLSSIVRDKTYKIYGDRPIPNEILKLIVDDMNEGWGHVASFSFYLDSIKIDLK